MTGTAVRFFSCVAGLWIGLVACPGPADLSDAAWDAHDRAGQDATSADRLRHDAASADRTAPDLGPAADANGDACASCGALQLNRVEPDSGGASASTPIEIAGQGFVAGARVWVGAQEATEVSAVDATRLRCTAPPIELARRGPATVRVELPGGAAAELAGGFTYLFDEDPILFVHGYLWNAADFDDMRQYFVDLGYPADMLDAIAYSDNTGSNVINARDELAPFVESFLAATGRDRLDIVGHSMGGLSSRLYIKAYGGADRVRDYVSLASPHHGAERSCWMTGAGADEQCPHYADQDSSVNGVQWELNGHPDQDDVDETPFGAEDGGAIFYTSIRYRSDIIVTPHDVSCLNQRSRGDCDDPVNIEIAFGDSHTGLIHNREVMDLVAQKVRAHNLSHPL